MTARLFAHPLAPLVMNNASVHLHGTREANGLTLVELLDGLCSMHAKASDAEWTSVLEFMARNDERTRLAWLLVHAFAQLDRTARFAAMNGLEVKFDCDLNEARFGDVHVTVSAAGRLVREQLDGEANNEGSPS
jgi:hypothetical protein